MSSIYYKVGNFNSFNQSKRARPIAKQSKQENNYIIVLFVL